MKVIFVLLFLITIKEGVEAFVHSHRNLQCSSTNLFAIDPNQMRVAEIKAELNKLRVGFADCFDKESLVAKLLWARENPTPEPTPQRPPPQPQQQPRQPQQPPRNIEFGAESNMDSDIDMDVFAAAGWKPEDENKGMSPVDHNRSPGLNRNFDELPTDDFKKPYFG